MKLSLGVSTNASSSLSDFVKQCAEEYIDNQKVDEIAKEILNNSEAIVLERSRPSISRIMVLHPNANFHSTWLGNITPT